MAIYIVPIWLSLFVCYLRSNDKWTNVACTTGSASVGALIMHLHMMGFKP